MNDIIRRKPRQLEDLIRDSGFVFQTGRLVGAAELAAHWMVMQDNEEAKSMGNKLHNIVQFYYEPEDS